MVVPSRMSLRTGLFAMLIAGSGCASSQTPAPEASAQAAASRGDGEGVAGAPPEACQGYATRMCERLGPQSDGCQSVAEVVELLPPQACEQALAGVSYSFERIDALRADCLTVADKLCERVGPESDICSKVRLDMRLSVPPGHCRGLLKAYPELEARLMAQLEREQPLDVDQQQALLAGSPPTFGPDGALVTLVEFSDFQCPYCAMAADAVKEIKAKYGDRVRFVFRQFPLSFHEHAQAAAEASMAAHAQGKFWDLHDLMFANQGELTPAALRQYAQQAGLDMAAYDKAVADGAYSDAVADDVSLGEQMMVSGTPTMFLNGKRVPNPTQFEAVEPLIEAALAEQPASQAPQDAP